jgi:tetratricopeptide (TPR) repeat protein
MQWAESEFANLPSVLGKARAAGDDVLAWRLPVTFTVIFELLGHTEDTIPELRFALTASRKIGDRTAEASILTSLANACQDVGQLDEAIACCQSAFAISAGLGDWYGQWLARYLEGYRKLTRVNFRGSQSNCY